MQKLTKQHTYRSIEDHIPDYRYMVDDDILMIGDNQLLSIIKISGHSFELEQDRELTAKYQRLKAYLLTLGQDAAGKIGVWFYLDRRKVEIDEQYNFDNEFIQKFSAKYMERFKNQGHFFKTTYFVAIVLNYSSSTLEEGIKKMHQYLDIASRMLSFSGISILKLKKMYNEPASFLAWLLNHQEIKVPFVDTTIKNTIASSDIHFGHDLSLIRSKNTSCQQYLAVYILRNFPANSSQGMLDFLLDIPCEFLLTQSFIFAKQLSSLGKINAQQNKINSSADVADEELTLLDHVKHLVQNNDIFLGSYDCVLCVYANSTKALFNNGNLLESSFSSRGYQLLRTGIEQQRAFLKILPSSDIKLLSSLRSTTTIADQFSLHNTSIGKKSGNPIGDGSSLMPIQTLQGGVHYFNTSNTAEEKNMQSEPIASHFLILGTTGTGKTVLQSSIASFMQRFNPMMFAIDFNESMRLPMLMMGAKYFVLRDGEYTGINPFQLDAKVLASHHGGDESEQLISKISETIKQFCYSLVERAAVGSSGVLEDGDAPVLKKAVDAVLALPVSERRFSLLLQSINKKSSLYTRLLRWCEDPVTKEQGRFAWALDSRRNIFDPLSMDKIGFDSTAILKKEADGSVNLICELILASLFFYKDLMQICKAKQGRWTLFTIEEFWMPANFPLTANAIKASLKAGRLKYEICGLISQSPADALKCDIVEAILEQTPTKILLPNLKAELADYEKIGLSSKEFAKFRTLGTESRTFLIKKSDNSIFGTFDLSGFDEFLPILSGDKEGIARAEAIITRIGSDDPAKWIPIFQAESRRSNREEEILRS